MGVPGGNAPYFPRIGPESISVSQCPARSTFALT